MRSARPGNASAFDGMAGDFLKNIALLLSCRARTRAPRRSCSNASPSAGVRPETHVQDVRRIARSELPFAPCRRLWSTVVSTAPSTGFQKLGQPVPLSNLVSDENSRWPQPPHRNVPARFSCIQGARAGALGSVLPQHVKLLGRERRGATPPRSWSLRRRPSFRVLPEPFHSRPVFTDEQRRVGMSSPKRLYRRSSVGADRRGLRRHRGVSRRATSRLSGWCGSSCRSCLAASSAALIAYIAAWLIMPDSTAPASA